jgi:hypothetical protein
MLLKIYKEAKLKKNNSGSKSFRGKAHFLTGYAYE